MGQVIGNIEYNDDGQPIWLLDFYVYTAYVSTLAAGDSATASLAIEANAQFEVMKSSYFCDIAGAVQTDSSRVIPLVSLAMADVGSGRNLQNIATPLANIAGSQGLPFNWPISRLFNAQSTIQLTFTNYSAATTYANLYYSLIGYKKFRYSPGDA